MTLQDFITLVNAEITASCSIPFSPPPAEIERIVKIEQEYLYREYRDAVQDGWYILNKKNYQTAEWKAQLTFQWQFW